MPRWFHLAGKLGQILLVADGAGGFENHLSYEAVQHNRVDPAMSPAPTEVGSIRIHEYLFPVINEVQHCALVSSRRRFGRCSLRDPFLSR